MSYVSDEDRNMLEALPEDKLIEIMMFNNRNIWRVDGLYFLGIENRFGTEAAAEIDAEVWNIMGTLEAKALKGILNMKDFSVTTLMNALHHTSWALDQHEKIITVENGIGILKILNCRTQLTRLKKGFPEFPCKQVRFSYLSNFAREINPHIMCNCIKCPPDEHTGDVWCEWQFVQE
ncbi:MAG: hypothetical protein HXS41_07395 [Theionarchaea archaeon]|nr:hypothetical protein [Theionarchaea archaeon]MBU7000152.1 hypothetical protein [Theionarchaea archaeon]MBU7020869.1 hypothetical protein [Theionarchaea archaeon]MBU7033894.1 hypothetical protein [Theionarchaea archaeon]MBU7039189.1 hypothetical protein [Theionarchaea archaeon]